MQTSNIILVTALIFFAIFALYREYLDHDDPFTYHKAVEKDSIFSSLTKVENCLNYEQKTIKWRRILLSTLLSILLLFGIFHQRFPAAKELLVYFFFIFVVFYMNWQHYTKRTASGAVIYGRENIANIRKQIAEKHSFILPINFV